MSYLFIVFAVLTFAFVFTALGYQLNDALRAIEKRKIKEASEANKRHNENQKFFDEHRN